MLFNMLCQSLIGYLENISLGILVFYSFSLAGLVSRFVEWEGICLLSIIFNQNLQGVFVC
nr:MAG TPA: hypothetical protein [Caudoviricetes sp.]